MSSLKESPFFRLYLAAIDETDGSIIDTGTPLITLDNQNNQPRWQTYQMSINAPSKYKLVFAGKTGEFIL